MVDFAAVAAAFARDLEAAGGEIRTGCGVRAVVDREDGVEVVTAGDPSGRAGSRRAGPAGSRRAGPAGSRPAIIRAHRAVACAGAGSARLAIASGAPSELRIVPFRGAYLRLRPGREHLVRGQIYPVPDPSLPFLGVHLSRTIRGEVLLGPNALLVGGLRWPGTWRVVRRWWRTGARELAHTASRRLVVRDLARYVPEIRPADVIRGPAGTRAQAVARDGSLVDDFAFAETAHAVHVLNAPSPAATASLAIAEAVADRLEGSDPLSRGH